MKSRLSTLSLLTLLLASPLPSTTSWASDGNISKVNGSIRVERGRQVGSVDTVNGSIEIEDSVKADNIETVSGSIDIGRDSTVGDIDTVNGNVTLADNAKADSVELVNGRLRLDDKAQVRGNVTSVNGSIGLGKGAEIGGKVENVNGKIEVDGGRIGKGIQTTSGDIDIGAGSRVDGGIVVEKLDHSFSLKKHTPKITIGPGAVVNGTLHFKREVELRISKDATVGKIVGATPIRE